MSLTCLKLLVSLPQLGFEVLDVVLGNSKLVLGVLQLGACVVEGIDLKVEVAVHTQ
jgi:predicted RNA methylase